MEKVNEQQDMSEKMMDAEREAFAPAAPDKVEQVPAKPYLVDGKIIGYSIDPDEYAKVMLGYDTLPAAGSAAEDLEEAASILRNMIDSIGVHGNYSQGSTLLFLNQALASIVAAISAQQSAPERVSVPVELLELIEKSWSVPNGYPKTVPEHVEQIIINEMAELRALLASRRRGEA